jgi:predicted permease
MQTIRYALRGLRKNPGFTLTALLSLALGIGANTAIFSLMDRIMLRSLPVRDPERLVLFRDRGPRRGNVETAYSSDFTFSYPMYRDFRDRAPAFDGVLAWFPASVSFSASEQSELVRVNLVTGNFFDVLGVRTVLGRAIVPDDDRVRSGGPVAVLSYGFWERRLGADPRVLNRSINLNGHPFTVVGVAAKGFSGLAVGEAPAAFVPVVMEREILPGRDELEKRRSMWLNLMGRLKPGVTRENAEAAMNTFWQPILADELKAIPQATENFRQRFLRRHLTLQAAGNGISNLRFMLGTPLILLTALVGLVLMIACANVANLFIARSAARQKEVAIRLALGAGKWAIVRTILAESLILSFAGAVLGVAFASWSGGLLVKLLPTGSIVEGLATNPDLRVLSFTAVTAVLSGLIFGFVPALKSVRPDVAPVLKDQAGSVLGGSVQARFRKALVVGQVALSLLLLIGAGLFMRSLRNLKAVDTGFRPDHIIGFTVRPSLIGYNDNRSNAFFDRLRERLAALPGVSALGTSGTPLLAGDDNVSSIVVPGRIPPENENAPNADVVSPGFFAALGTPLLAGREFTAQDSANAPRVAVVNETFARVYFGGENPIGRTFSFMLTKDVPVEVVGLVKDGKYSDLREEKQRFVFVPYAQDPSPTAMTFYVRTSGEPEALSATIRQVIHEADPQLPVYSMKTMEAQIDESMFADRIISLLSAFFGVLATLLAAVGLYGVMSYVVTRRTREIGIRVALGANRNSVVSLILSEIALMVGIGIVIAIPLSIPLARMASSLLYGIGPQDPAVIAAASLVLMASALLAAYVPAARATRVDPLEALRTE